MPFDDDDVKPSVKSQKTSLKNVSTQPSFIADKRKSTKEEFSDRVEEIHNKQFNHQQASLEKAQMFKSLLDDRTLEQNKTIVAKEAERALVSEITSMISAIDNDPDEELGRGSLTWITILLKTCLYQRDRINKLEYMANNLNARLRVIEQSNKKNE